MSNRGCLILSVLLMLAGNVKPAFAQRHAVQVHVYDHAGLKPKAFQELAARTQEILAETGLSVEVVACPSNTLPCKGGGGGSPTVAIVEVVPGEAKHVKNLLRPPLGQAFVDADGGTCATVFLGRVPAAAGKVDLSWLGVLRYAAGPVNGHPLLRKRC